MIATYAVGGFGLFMSLLYLGRGESGTSADWAAAVAVGGSGLLSFVRHSIFHRSDAARMKWDLGRRNDFQIEVGFANLSWGLVGIAAWLFEWGTRAEGAVVLVFGLYMVMAAALHGSELRRAKEEGGGRAGPAVASLVFAGFLIWAGAAAVTV